MLSSTRFYYIRKAILHKILFTSSCSSKTKVNCGKSCSLLTAITLQIAANIAQNRRQKVFNRGLDIENLIKTPLICSVSYRLGQLNNSTN